MTDCAHSAAMTDTEYATLDALADVGVTGLDECLDYFYAKHARCESCCRRALDVAAAAPFLAARYWYVLEVVTRVHFANTQAAHELAAATPDLAPTHRAVNETMGERWGESTPTPEAYLGLLAEVLETLDLAERRTCLQRWSALAASGENGPMRAAIDRLFDDPVDFEGAASWIR